MVFYSLSDMCADSKKFWNIISGNDEIVITKDGKPSALIVGFPEDRLEEMIKVVRQAKALAAFNVMRHKAETRGYMSDDEIDAEINAAREEQSYSLY